MFLALLVQHISIVLLNRGETRRDERVQRETRHREKHGKESRIKKKEG